jgi:hypothetical protein
VVVVRAPVEAEIVKNGRLGWDGGASTTQVKVTPPRAERTLAGFAQTQNHGQLEFIRRNVARKKQVSSGLDGVQPVRCMGGWLCSLMICLRLDG